MKAIFLDGPKQGTIRGVRAAEMWIIVPVRRKLKVSEGFPDKPVALEIRQVTYQLAARGTDDTLFYKVKQ